MVVVPPEDTAAVTGLFVCHVLPDGNANEIAVVLLDVKGIALLFTQLFVRPSQYT